MKRLLSLAIVAVAFTGAVIPTLAQQQPLDWVPRGIEELGHTAAFHTDFTFDRTMLQMASGVFYGGDQDVAHAVARLNGISVHSYRFAAAGMYDPSRLQAVREQYRVAGWKHLVSSESHSPYASTGRTDLWIDFQGANVTGMVVLLAGIKELNLIAVSGNLSPLDLLHLRGHFGIPRFSGDQLVPDTGHPDTGHPASGRADTGHPDSGHPDTGHPNSAQPSKPSPAHLP
ncbi:MAG: hypothetical protein ACR2JE_14915 [Acidobacteriaceae bacterium]